MYTECVRSRLHMDVGIAPGLQYDCGLQVVLGLCLLWLHCDVEIRIANLRNPVSSSYYPYADSSA